MGIEQPQLVAIRGGHAPVIAHARAPAGIVKPPFRRDAFGPLGRHSLKRPAAPAKAHGRIGQIGRGNGFWAKQHQRPGPLGGGPTGGGRAIGGGLCGLGFLGNMAVGGVFAGDPVKPHPCPDARDQIIKRLTGRAGAPCLCLCPCLCFGGDGPAALVFNAMQRLGHGGDQPQDIKAKARVDPAQLQRKQRPQAVGPVGGAGQPDLDPLRAAFGADHFQPQPPRPTTSRAQLVAKRGQQAVKTGKDIGLQPDGVGQADPGGEMQRRPGG